MKKEKRNYDSPAVNWQRINMESAFLNGSRQPGDARISGFADDEDTYTW